MICRRLPPQIPLLCSVHPHHFPVSTHPNRNLQAQTLLPLVFLLPSCCFAVQINRPEGVKTAMSGLIGLLADLGPRHGRSNNPNQRSLTNLTCSYPSGRDGALPDKRESYFTKRELLSPVKQTRPFRFLLNLIFYFPPFL